MVAVNELGEWVKTRRQGLGIGTRKKFSVVTGVAETLIYELETGRGKPFHERRDVIRSAVALHLKTTVADLDAFSRGESGPPPAVSIIVENKSPSGVNMSTVTPGRDAPHFHGVSAAKLTHREPITRDSIPAPTGGADTFWITVDGDCMEPEFPHGTMVLFSPSKAVSSLASGKAYFVQLDDGESTFKNVVIPVDNRHEVILHPTNPKYPDRTILRENIQIIARVVGTFNPK